MDFRTVVHELADCIGVDVETFTGMLDIVDAERSQVPTSDRAPCNLIARADTGRLERDLKMYLEDPRKHAAFKIKYGVSANIFNLLLDELQGVLHVYYSE